MESPRNTRVDCHGRSLPVATPPCLLSSRRTWTSRALFAQVCSKSDAPPLCHRRMHQLANCGKNADNRLIVRSKPSLEALELARQGLVGLEQLPNSHE